MQLDKIEDVLSENLGEGYRIVRDNDELSPIIEWVDWVNQSENDENEEAILSGQVHKNVLTFLLSNKKQ